MGSCISKCRPKKKPKEDPLRHVHDKLVVISKDPPPAASEITIMPSDKPLPPAPSSAASFSSFSYDANNKSATTSSISSSSSLSSLSSSSYSSSVSKDRSFTNDFLWSCVKENPHVIGLNEKSVDSKSVLYPNRIHPPPLLAKKKQTAVQERQPLVNANAASTPKKRARASSPTLMRQKSFRKEQNFAPTRGLRSPSPSRRFNGESNRIFPVKESYYCKPVVSRGSNAVSSAPRRESFRAPTPSRKREVSIGGEYSERRNDEFLQHVSSKVDGIEIDDVVMEDINNPLIALDCFIFL